MTVSTGVTIDGTIEGAIPGDNTVDTIAIIDGEVMSVDIAVGGVDTINLANGSVTASKLGPGAVTDVAITGPISISKLDTDPLARANHTGTQLLSTISDAGTSASLDVPATGDAALNEVVKGDDTRLTDSRTPSGSAGGDLSGSYPNPTVVDDSHSHTLSTITDSGTAAALDVPASGDAAVGEVVKGDDTRLTDSRNPDGAAGGDLSGTYPNPSVVDDSHSHTTSTITDFYTTRLDEFAAPNVSLSMGTQKVTNVVDPTDPQDAATKAYVDQEVGTRVFGDGYQFNENAVLASTSLTTPIEKARVDLTGIDAGDYIVFGTFEFYVSNANGRIDLEIVQDPDGAATIVEDVVTGGVGIGVSSVLTLMEQVTLAADESFACRFFHASGSGSSTLVHSNIYAHRVA